MLYEEEFDIEREREQRRERKYRRKKRRMRRVLLSLIALIIIIFAALYFKENMLGNHNKGIETFSEALANGKRIQLEYLTPNPNSRPQEPLKKVNGIVIHYVGNPGTSAMANRNYFQGLSISKETYASSHFVIGLEGEIIQCIPLTEISYASNERNEDTIAIECCHPDDDGKFNEATYESVMSLVGKLCVEYGLDEDDVIRHYDVTGKKCPLFYVDHPEAWEQLKADLKKEIQEIKENEK